MPLYALGDQEPTIDPTAYIHPDAVLIGDVRIGPESSVWPGAVLRGDNGYISVGAQTSIQDGAIIHTTLQDPTIVGDRCIVGHAVHLEGCVIHDDCLVGSNSTVLQGAVVGPNALVAAGAVVNNGKVVPQFARALGVPARVQENTVAPGEFEPGWKSYVAKVSRYRDELRRLDG